MTRHPVKTQGRILLGFLFVSSVLFTFSLSAWSEWKLQHRALEARARVIADSLMASATEPLLNYDVVALDDVLEAIRAAPPEDYLDLGYAMILDGDGRVLAHSHGYQDYGRIRRTNGTETDRRAETLGPAGVYEVSRPVIAGGKRWGTIRVGLTLSELRGQLVASWLRTLLVMSAIFAMLGVLSGQLTRRAFLRPIASLMRAAKALGRHEFDWNIPHDRTDEFGRLFDAMNDVALMLRDREKLYATFGRYVTDQVRDAILAGSISSTGKKVNAAVLFADLRGFTGRSEPLPPEEVLDLLNGFCSRMTTAIHAHGGIVDKFIGDSVMAVFGTPIPDPDCAIKAVMAAEAMRRQLQEFNLELTAAGKEPLRMGIGIHVGACVAGSVGPPTRQQYTVVGDTVNVASRLQDLSKLFGVEALISQDVYEACGPWLLVRDLGKTPVEGRGNDVHVFELIGAKHGDRESSEAIAREREREDSFG